MNGFMYRVGDLVFNYLKRLLVPLHYFSYIFDAFKVKRGFKGISFRRLIFKELYYAGIMAIPVVIILGLSTGFLTMLIFPFDKLSFGIENIYGSVFSTLIFKELAPLVTSLVVVIRSSVYITIHISRMKIGGEIEALEIMGINPVRYIGVERILAGVITVPVLGLYCVGGALLASLLTTAFNYNVPVNEFFGEIMDTFSLDTILVYLVKSMISGAIVYITAIYIGLTTKKEKGVLVSKTIQSITFTILLIFLFNIIVTGMIYGPN